MKPGIYKEMSNEEYRKAPAVNYSALSSFNLSQDHALIVTQNKSYFEYGKAFESFIKDASTGSEDFKKRFFICDAKGNMPPGLADWIEKGIDLNTKYKLNKDNSRSKVAETLHSWLDACLLNPGKMPMSQFEYDQLCIMAANFLDMDIYGGLPLKKLLSIASFSVPIFWDSPYGIKKKALIDVVIQTKVKTYAYDIKTTASISNKFTNFKKMLRSSYWIQDIHYSEGIQTVFKNPMPFMFLVSSKNDPYLSQPLGIDAESRPYAQDKYNDLVSEYIEWKEKGRPFKGWKSYEEIKLYL